MNVSGIYTARNAIEAGYPFVESLLSVLPLVDEFLLNDGGSDDGTWPVLCRLADQYPGTIELYQIDDYRSERWETIDEQLEELIAAASGDWLIESQADEIWPRETLECTERAIEAADDDGYRSVRQPRVDVSGYERTAGVMETVRVVRNVDGLSSYEGGDNFQIGERGRPTNGYTNHGVRPEYRLNAPFYHFPWPFPRTNQRMRARHAKWLATESEVRRRAYERHD